MGKNKMALVQETPPKMETFLKTIAVLKTRNLSFNVLLMQ